MEIEMVPIEIASEKLNYSKKQINRWIAEKKVISEKVPGCGRGGINVLVSLDSCHEYIQNRSNKTRLIDMTNGHFTEQTNGHTNRQTNRQTKGHFAKQTNGHFQSDILHITPTSVSSATSQSDICVKSNIQPGDTWLRASTAHRKRAIAKWHIVTTYRNLVEQNKKQGVKKLTTLKNFVAQLKSGSACQADMLILQTGGISKGCIQNWESKLVASGELDNPESLLEAYSNCGRTISIDTMILNEIRAMSATRSYTPDFIYRYLCEKYNDEQFSVSKSSVRKYVQTFRNDKSTMNMNGKTNYKNNVKLHNVRINDLLPGEKWESDGHIFNVFVKSPFYRHHDMGKRYLIRPVLIAWRDVATGLIVGWRVCLSENKTAVRMSLYDAIAHYGLPKMIWLDNGGAYKNVEYAPQYFFKQSDGKTKLTAAEKIARNMIENGDKGLYASLGIDYHFCIPGNPESKSIEPAWRHTLSNFEQAMPGYCGNDIANRPEWMNGIETKVLARNYADRFLDWETFVAKVNAWINDYNNAIRPCLQDLSGNFLTPLETYAQTEHKTLNKYDIDHIMIDKYIEMKIVQRSILEKNGIYYWHPSFASMVGKKIGIYYDEKDLRTLTICSDRGQRHPEAAIAITPGLQSGDDLSAMIENAQRARIGKLFYTATLDVNKAAFVKKWLETETTDVLPIADLISGNVEEVKYLSFEDALDQVETEYNVSQEDTTCHTEHPICHSERSEEPSDTDDDRKTLADDIACMFG